MQRNTALILAALAILGGSAIAHGDTGVAFPVLPKPVIGLHDSGAEGVSNSHPTKKRQAGQLSKKSNKSKKTAGKSSAGVEISISIKIL